MPSRPGRSPENSRTAPALCDETGLRFGVSGDWRGELAPYPAIRNIQQRDLDFFVLHGDTIYAENYSLPGTPVQRSKVETPLLR